MECDPKKDTLIIYKDKGYHDDHVRLAESGSDGSTFVIGFSANV